MHGERNTSFFHLTSLIRRSFNKITCIENEYGILTHDMEEVKSLFLDGFKSLYQTEMVSSSIFNQIDPRWCVQITQVDAETLILPPGLMVFMPASSKGSGGMLVILLSMKSSRFFLIEKSPLS